MAKPNDILKHVSKILFLLLTIVLPVVSANAAAPVGQTIWIRASKPIRKGQELTYDYNTEGDKVIPCRCRPGCKTKL